MMKIIVLFCLIASTLAQQVNVNNSTGINNEFFDVNTCDDSTKDGRLITALNSALTQWKVESKQEFCALQCLQDQCVDQFEPLGSSLESGRDQFQEGQLDQFQDSQQGQVQDNQQDNQFRPMLTGQSSQQGQVQDNQQDNQFRPMLTGQSAQQGQVQDNQQGDQFRPMLAGQSSQQGQVQGNQQDGQFRTVLAGQSAQQGQVRDNQQDGQLRPMLATQSAQQGQVQDNQQDSQFRPVLAIQAAQQGQARPMVRNKRQAVNINNSVISDSTFISVNVCKMPKFQDLLKPINKFISNMKKTDFKDLCRLHREINICNCYVPTTTPYYYPTTTPYYAPTTTPYYHKTPTTTYGSYSRSY